MELYFPVWFHMGNNFQSLRYLYIHTISSFYNWFRFISQKLIFAPREISNEIKFSRFSFPKLIIGFISDADRYIGNSEHFHLAKVLTAHDYFRLFTSTWSRQAIKLCKTLPQFVLLQFVSRQWVPSLCEWPYFLLRL